MITRYKIRKLKTVKYPSQSVLLVITIKNIMTHKINPLRIKRTFPITLFLLIANTEIQGQSIATDSRGKDVFNFYKSKTFSVPVSASTTSIKLNATFRAGPGKQFYIVDTSQINNYSFLSAAQRDSVSQLDFDTISLVYSKSDSSKFTLAKSMGLNFSFTIGNLISNFAKVSTFHPTYTISAGFGYNIDIFNNWNNLRQLSGFWSWNINPYISFNNLNIYDTISHAQSRRKPSSEGIEGEANFYFPRLAKNSLIGISVSFTYEFGNNIPELKNFQKNSPTYIDPNAIALGDFVGKLGDLHANNNIRTRISLPIFPKAFKLFRYNDKGQSKWRDSLQISIYPYYSFYGVVQTHLSNLVGLYVNATQGQNLFANNSTIVSGLGVGIDWTAAPNGLSNASIFIAGSLDLHNILAHNKPKAIFLNN